MARRVDVIAVCTKCRLQFEITKAESEANAQDRAEEYHRGTSVGCEGEIHITVLLDTDRLKGLPPAPESELQRELTATLKREFNKRTRTH